MYGSLYRSTSPRALSVTSVAAIATGVVGVAIAVVVACRGSDSTHHTAQGTVAGAPVTASAPATGSTAATPIAVPADVSYATADSSFRLGHYAEAVALFDAYTKRRPGNTWGYYMLGLSAWKAGELDRARDAFEAALERDPRHVKSLVNLSRVLLDENHDGEALRRVSGALAIDSGNSDAWRVRGRAEGRLGHRDAALDAYRMAIALDSTDTWSMNNTGLLLIDAGPYGEAIGPLARAVQLDAGIPAFQNNLGIALERSGYATAAAQSFRAALDLDSSYVKAKVSLVRVDGRPDRPGLEPLDLDARGVQFAQDIMNQHGAGTAEAPSPTAIPADSTLGH